jgi:chemotaxis response regulator CheB
MRVVLVKLPGILGEIVSKVISAEPDMALVGVTSAYKDLLPVVRETRADAVIIGLDSSESAQIPDYRELFDDRTIVLVAVGGDGRDAFACSLQPERAPIGDLSSAALADAIRRSLKRG